MLMDYKDKQEEIGKNKHFIRSFEFALTGIKTVYREERNMRTHTIAGILTIIAGIIFRLNRWEWLWILLSIFLVLVMEMINTAFENVVDMVTDFHFHSIGKKSKTWQLGQYYWPLALPSLSVCSFFYQKFINGCFKKEVQLCQIINQDL